jgi:protein-L-isoaspartate(D-aspartate) O-methyltransferase
MMSRNFIYLSIILISFSLAYACGSKTSTESDSIKTEEPKAEVTYGNPPATEEENVAFAVLREKMVKGQIAARGIDDKKVLEAMRKVPRHELMPTRVRKYAYDDNPAPIGEDQTISQPYIVAFMTEALRLKGTEKVLEIGTGSGYQAAVLAEIVPEVYSIEIITELSLRAGSDLRRLGYKNIKLKAGDGYQGWKEYAPFDAIIVTAAPDHVPQPLVEQLAPGGRMIIPVGDHYQNLQLIEKDKNGELKEESILPVRFVPMTGEAQTK